jgi:hypothetical protein
MRTVAAALFVVAVGCGGDDGFGMGIPEVDCSEPIPRFLEVRAFPGTCNSCHTVQIADDDPRRDAPPGMNYDNYAQAVANAEGAAITVNEGTMPLSGGLTFTDRKQLFLWALCGTPQ